ncbi:hypothetical protein MRS44_008528 [Fusarium solani]|uniref:uncharacterized protein n=1 Tax=Fusarium solani TaxID=169388 RepID=UPI0032C4184C|nr:hypothetical protein MRS44_008528 [Fusarium solani]
MAFASPWAVAKPPFGFPQFVSALPDVSQAASVLAASPGPYQELTRRLEICKQKLAAQDGTLRSTVKEHLNMAVNRLEIALLQLYKLAVFIRGDYDGRQDDDVQKMTIFDQCSRAFGDCQAASQTGLEQLSSIHIQVASFQTDEIEQLKRDIQGALEQTRMEMDANQHQTERSQQDVEVWARQQQEAADALQRAQDERENTGNQLPEGFSFLGGFVFGDVEGNIRKIEQETRRLHNAQEQWLKAHNSLIEVMNRQNELNVRRVALEQLAQQVPTLQVTTDGLNKGLAALLGGFVDLKERATKLLLLIDEMKNRAAVTMRQAYKKAMFAEGILTLCRMALIDGRVCDEVETITLEISGGYSGQSVPESVSQLLTEVGQAARETAQKSITG